MLCYVSVNGVSKIIENLRDNNASVTKPMEDKIIQLKEIGNRKHIRLMNEWMV